MDGIEEGLETCPVARGSMVSTPGIFVNAAMLITCSRKVGNSNSDGARPVY